MITPRGKFHDPSLMPEGIVLTLPVVFFQDRNMTPATFEKYFERFMQGEDAIWNFKLTNLPKMDIAHVYLCFDGFIQFRLNLVMYERNVSKTFRDSTDHKVREFPHANWVIMSGPAVKAPIDIPQKGFQGFRYCTFLF